MAATYDINPGDVFGYYRISECATPEESVSRRYYRATRLCCGEEDIVFARKLVSVRHKAVVQCRDCWRAAAKGNAGVFVAGLHEGPELVFATDATGHQWPALSGWPTIHARTTEY